MAGRRFFWEQDVIELFPEGGQRGPGIRPVEGARRPIRRVLATPS
jgi:hypothetical protein